MQNALMILLIYKDYKKVKKLKKASNAHAGQASDLEKAINEKELDIENESEYTLDEGKMKELAMKIADVYMKMKNKCAKIIQTLACTM